MFAHQRIHIDGVRGQRRIHGGDGGGEISGERPRAAIGLCGEGMKREDVALVKSRCLQAPHLLLAP